MPFQNMLENEFALDPDIIYLNHAAVAPWPRRTMHAVQAFAEENHRQGAKDYPKWIETEHRLRERLAELINAPRQEDIALLKSTSEALSFVAFGLDWQPGDNIVIGDQEFPSNRIVWESLHDRGVELRQVDLEQGESPEAALLAAMDRNTRLLSISSVQYASGLQVNLHILGEYCRAHNVLFCVDAIQSLGAIPLDVQAINADFVMADGHKWMLGPEGLALFYCRAELRAQLRLSEYGWHMVEDCLNFDARDWHPARSARRFECGSPNMLAAHALNASLSLLLEVGIDVIEQKILANSHAMFEAIKDSRHLSAVTPSQSGRYAGIISFRHGTMPSETLYAQLMQQGVICACRGNAVRFSPHFYTALDKIYAALSRTDKAIEK